MGSAHSYTARQNLIRHSQASPDSRASTYTNRVNVSRLTGVNVDAFVRNATLLGRLGGEESLNALVRYFYGKALQNPLSKHLFDAPDAITMENRIQKQIAYLRAILGGVDDGTVDIAGVNNHLASLNVSGEQFGAVVEAIDATLRSQNVQPEVMEEVIKFAEGLRGKVVR